MVSFNYPAPQTRAEATQARLDALMERLRESGIDPDTFFPDQG